MSRPDWVALQQEYIAEYTRSGISPAAWCEAKGLNYQSARRYIKKPSKNAHKDMRNTAQKGAQKKTAQTAQTAQKRSDKTENKKSGVVVSQVAGNDLEISFSPDEFGISDQQAKFAMLVAQGKNLIEAYRLAGYKSEGNAASAGASQLLRNTKVYRAISWFRNQYQKRYTAELDQLVSQLVAIVKADPNELAQFRRVNCRYCWGDNHLYQWRDIAEFDKAAEKASKDGKPAPEYGGLGFVDNAIPNPDCPKCCGEGRGEIHIADTTMLDGDARLLYAGAKYGKFGVEILMEDKGVARRELLKYLANLKKPLPENGEESANTDLDDEWKRLRNEKLRTEIENLRKGAGGENNEVIIHNSLPVPGADNVD